MTQTAAKDISRWQGTYTETGEPIVIVKISGGDDGLYYDNQASGNYKAAIANGHAFGGYHFAGGTDPIAEANFFVNGMKPLLKGEVPILDWEINNPDPVGWCLKFINQVEVASGDKGGIIYMNLATLRAHNWKPVLAKWGLWLADWNNNPQGVIDTGGIVYVMQQFNDGPNYDHDMFFGTKEQFQQYGWGYPTKPPVQPPTPPAPILTTESVTEIKALPFSRQTIEDPNLAKGVSNITQVGVNGSETVAYTVTKTNGVETSRVIASDTVTIPPINEVTTVGTFEAPVNPVTITNTTANLKATIVAIIAAFAAAIGAFLAWLHT